MKTQRRPPSQRAVARAIEGYTASLDLQVVQVDGWPDALVFPEPRTPAQREAFTLFCAALEHQLGSPMRIRFRQ